MDRRPFNIASHAPPAPMIGRAARLEPGEFVHSFGDVHPCSNHVQQAHEQLARTPKLFPRLTLNPGRRDVLAFNFEKFMPVGYDPHPHIRAEVAA